MRVRGPKHVVNRGKMPVLAEEEAGRLLDSIKIKKKVTLPDSAQAEVPWVVGLRDRALIGVMVHTFARISAVVGMQVEDYFANGKRWWVRQRRKAASITKCRRITSSSSSSMNISRRPGSAITTSPPSFRSAAGRTGMLTDRPMHRVDAYEMIRRRTAEAGLKGKLGCHVFRATGITAYLEAGGTLENAQAMAAHESQHTTKLYDRTGDEITLDEVERITI
jgi:integrase